MTTQTYRPPNHIAEIRKRRTMVRSVDAVAQAHLIKLLLDGQHSCHQLADEVGLGYNTVLRYCRELHMRRAVHIHAWAPNKAGARVLKLYKIGCAPDIPRGTA